MTILQTQVTIHHVFFFNFHVLHIFKFHRGKFLLTTTKHSPKALFRSSRLEVFHKKVFLRFLQNSKENTCARVSESEIPDCRCSIE